MQSEEETCQKKQKPKTRANPDTHNALKTTPFPKTPSSRSEPLVALAKNGPPPIRHLHKAPHLNLSKFSVQSSTFNVQSPAFPPPVHPLFVPFTPKDQRLPAITLHRSGVQRPPKERHLPSALTSPPAAPPPIRPPQAPKGPNTPAQGNALGSTPTLPPAPNGRNNPSATDKAPQSPPLRLLPLRASACPSAKFSVQRSKPLPPSCPSAFV